MRERRETRSFRKIWLVLGVFALLVFGTALTASAANLRQNGVKNKSVSISWDDPNSGSSYSTTTAYHIEAGIDRSHISIYKDLPASTKNYTLTGLSEGEEYYVKVTYDYKNTSGNNYTGGYVGAIDAQTLPAKPSALKVNSFSTSMTWVEFAWTGQNISGYQWVLKNAAGATVDSGEIGYASNIRDATLTSYKTKANSVYTFQVRGFSKAYNSNEKVYGAWSDTGYFVPQPQLKGKKYTKVNANGTLSVKWTKVKGATSYTVYVSTKRNSGYKKVKTLKKNSVKIKKFKGKKFKNNKYYYIYVVANKKVGGNTIKSPKAYCWYVKRYVY